MTRLYLVLVASMISMCWTAVESSAQSDDQNAEAYCLKNPSHPVCIAVLNEYCTERPNEPVCMSDDDDED